MTFKIPKTIEDEIWKDVPGYEGYYRVSSHGNVRSMRRDIMVADHIRTIAGKRLKPSLNPKGYRTVVLNKNGNGWTVKVAKLVAITFIKNMYNKPQVNHIDGDKTNDNINNLEWVTNQENTIHSFRLGRRSAIGEGHPHSKLRKEDILEIRNSNLPGTILSKIFDIGTSQISAIRRFQSWRHVN